ncbi:MAG: hypothetical protein JNG88_14445 [Phycisphaerales bacterium]|nr:hypothetical protein [Phycisphaerales bacterium]
MTSKLSAAPYNFDFEMMRSNVTSALANESFAGGEQAADYSRQIADDSLTGYYLYLPNSGIYTPNGNQHEGVVPVKPNNSVQQVRLSNLVVNGTAYSANVNFRIVVEKK